MTEDVFASSDSVRSAKPLKHAHSVTFDEPLAPLDPRHVLEVLALAREITRAGATVLMSLHDLRVASCLDVVAVLHDGRMRAVGRPDDVLTPELFSEVFGVRARRAPGLILELP